MTNYKKEIIEDFLSKKYQQEIKLKDIPKGMDSIVYFFKLEKKEYIIRINSKIDGFKKDEYAYNNFKNEIIKIPKIIEYGTFFHDYYCISEKIEGITFQDATSKQVEKLLPGIFKIMEEINKIDISQTNGYGIIDYNTGNAPYKSWKEYLYSIFDKKYNWNLLYQKTYINKKLLQEIILTFKNLLPYCKNNRKLLHGDFGSNNLIINNLKITGVIDWNQASYGDPLMEIANAYFWSTWLLCMQKTVEYYQKNYREADNVKIINCYQLHIGLKELYENALDDNIKMCNWLQDRLKNILNNIKI